MEPITILLCMYLLMIFLLCAFLCAISQDNYIFYFASFLYRCFCYVLRKFFPNTLTIVIEQHFNATENETYSAAEVYVPTRKGSSTNNMVIGSNDARNFTSAPTVVLPAGTKVTDDFEGMHFVWTVKSRSGRKYFCLTCKKVDEEAVKKKYIPYIIRMAKEILLKREEENLYIYRYNQKASKWESTVFHRTSTFETLTLDNKVKDALLSDLDLFVNRKACYKGLFLNAVRSWKRSYLIYGPSGSGKTSLVAAIADRTRYNIYDVQLHCVKNDAELRNMLITTPNRSIILLEDVECCSQMMSCDGSRANKQVEVAGATSSGLLNFLDGLWSVSGDERIIIVTTTDKDKLDQALLRPGRLDYDVKLVSH